MQSSSKLPSKAADEHNPLFVKESLGDKYSGGGSVANSSHLVKGLRSSGQNPEFHPFFRIDRASAA